MATITATDRGLRGALAVDGALTLLSGLALVPLAGVLHDPLGLPSAALLVAGVFFALWGAGLLYLGTRPAANHLAAGVVVEVNAACAVGCAVIAAAGLTTTTTGTVAMVALAVAVAAIATVQWRELRAVKRGSRP